MYRDVWSSIVGSLDDRSRCSDQVPGIVERDEGPPAPPPLDDGQGAVGTCGDPPALVWLEAEHVQRDRPDDAVMAHRDGRTVRVPVGHAVEGGERAAAEIDELLTARIAVVGALAPAGVPVGIPAAGLGAVESREVADVDLAQAGRQDWLEAGFARELGGRLGGAQEVARIDRVEPLAGEAPPERLRLSDSRGVQGLVGVALPAALAIPIGLAVAREQDPGHLRRS